MDYKTFVDLILALEYRHTTQALRFFWPLLDVKKRGCVVFSASFSWGRPNSVLTSRPHLSLSQRYLWYYLSMLLLLPQCPGPLPQSSPSQDGLITCPKRAGTHLLQKKPLGRPSWGARCTWRCDDAAASAGTSTCRHQAAGQRHAADQRNHRLDRRSCR